MALKKTKPTKKRVKKTTKLASVVDAGKKEEIVKDIFSEKRENYLPETNKLSHRITNYHSTDTFLYICVIFAVLAFIFLVFLILSPGVLVESGAFCGAAIVSLQEELVYLIRNILFAFNQFFYGAQKALVLAGRGAAELTWLPGQSYLAGVNFVGEGLTQIAARMAEMTINAVK